jgi:hypothetical protein
VLRRLWHLRTFGQFFNSVVPCHQAVPLRMRERYIVDTKFVSVNALPHRRGQAHTPHAQERSTDKMSSITFLQEQHNYKCGYGVLECLEAHHLNEFKLLLTDALDHTKLR